MSARVTIKESDRFGFVRPGVDAHTLGINSVEQILNDCGFASYTAPAEVCEALNRPEKASGFAVVRQWIRDNAITILGFSYRLNPHDGATLFGLLVRQLKSSRLLSTQGGQIRALFFAGLPETCELVRRCNPEVSGVFVGDESPAETLRILGIETGHIPRALSESVAYDEARLSFGRNLIRKGDYLGVRPVSRDGYDGYGTKRDTLMARLRQGQERHLPPLMRAHVGPYLPDRSEAVQLFLDWTRRLARGGLLDILSIGTSQLTQSEFGQDWGQKPNGGGVPLNSREEFEAVWQAARPMLVRAYAGTRDVPGLARMYEETINIAWHALSFWWFCRIDGRGPYAVLENLQQHFRTLEYIATTGKPFEPNVPHHFAFRGADDVTDVVSAFLAAKAAKRMGIRRLILQVMLNTPKYVWGIQDLAKARAMLHLVRALEDDRFRVILQPRGGLDYFSPDPRKAKEQLAAVTALMDDIEPHDPASPALIHVVSYTEAFRLADPTAVEESIKITRHALEEYRILKARGLVEDMAGNPEVESRTAGLISEARSVVIAIEAAIPNAYSPEGFYRILVEGFLPVPYLWECREEFSRAVSCQTRLIRGSVRVVDEQGGAVPAQKRMDELLASRR